ncbi:MAG: hypothetical protein ACRDSR_00355 [Pseudonocardiaceae bacterium]
MSGDEMGDLHLEICPTKSRYGVEDDVPLRVLLFNFGDEPVTVNARFAVGASHGPGELLFSVTAPSGETLPFGARVNIGYPQRDDFATIQPFACVGKLIDLVDYFPLSEPGTYLIEVQYRSRPGGEDSPPGAWTGTLQSDSVTIELE